MGQHKDSPERRRRKRRRWQDNQRRRARLIEQGFTEDEARAIIESEGRVVNALFQEQQKRDAAQLRALRDAEKERFPKQPRDPQSVRDFPSGGFETNRRKH